jgi:hypothetical protein
MNLKIKLITSERINQTAVENDKRDTKEGVNDEI